MPIPREQLRMSPEQLESFLLSQRTLRLGTVSEHGAPHVTPLWFVWHDGTVWLNNLRRSRRSADLAGGSQVAACIDAGFEYAELHGAVLYGRFEDATGDPRLEHVRAEFGRKYFGGVPIPDTRSHVWLRMVPDRVVSWDFAKIPAGRDKRLEAKAD